LNGFGFGFHIFCLTRFGLDLTIFYKLFAIFGAVSGLHITAFYLWSLFHWNFSHPCGLHMMFLQILWPVIHIYSLLYHVIKVRKLVWLSLIQPLSVD